jgi:exodeoxyribonuclease VII small subunit
MSIEGDRKRAIAAQNEDKWEKAKKQETYSQAIKRLEEIVRQIDNNELEIDQLSEKIKEANEIILFCSEKLTKADKEIENLLKENNNPKNMN